MQISDRLKLAIQAAEDAARNAALIIKHELPVGTWVKWNYLGRQRRARIVRHEDGKIRIRFQTHPKDLAYLETESKSWESLITADEIEEVICKPKRYQRPNGIREHGTPIASEFTLVFYVPGYGLFAGSEIPSGITDDNGLRVEFTRGRCLADSAESEQGRAGNFTKIHAKLYAKIA